MNKDTRKVKLISKNVLESLVYYSRFNPLYSENTSQCIKKLSLKFIKTITIVVNWYEHKKHRNFDTFFLHSKLDIRVIF